MLQRIKDFIIRNDLIQPQDRLIAGVSGGADSVCLLLILKELAPIFDASLEVIHVEHGIRGEESCADAVFTERLCRENGISFQLVRVDVPAFAGEQGLGLEEAARLLRYEAFLKQARKQQGKIVLAHHMEDNAETLLFHMVRGSGLKGLAGMQPRRELAEGVICIRPLLCVRRAEIEEFLKERNQKFCFDQTNLDVEYSRNRLRNMVFPELVNVNVQAVQHMNQCALQLAEIRDFMEEQVEVFLQNIICQEEPLKADIEQLIHLHPALQKEVVYELISRTAKQRKDISATHVQAVLSLNQRQSGKQVSLPYGIVVKREYNFLVFLKNDMISYNTIKKVSGKESDHYKGSRKFDGHGRDCDCADSDKIYHISMEQIETLRGGGTLKLFVGEQRALIEISILEFDGDLDKIPKKRYTKWLDCGKIKNSFQVRTRRAGDYFVNDSKGHRKKLKEYFINEKIPADLRDKIWLLADGPQVLCIIGGRVDAAYCVTPDTRDILQIYYNGGE